MTKFFRLTIRLCGEIDKARSAPALPVVDRLVLSRKNDLEQLAVVRPVANGVPDARRLDPARARPQGLDPMALELRREPALEAIDELEIDIVVVARAQLGAERLDHPDHMRLGQAVGRRRD